MCLLLGSELVKPVAIVLPPCLHGFNAQQQATAAENLLWLSARDHVPALVGSSVAALVLPGCQGADLSEAAEQLWTRQRERLGRALTRLSKELYSSNTHFVLELVQVKRQGYDAGGRSLHDLQAVEEVPGFSDCDIDRNAVSLL